MILEQENLIDLIAKINEQWGYFESDQQPPPHLRSSAWEVHSLAETTTFLLTVLDKAGVAYKRPDFPYVGGLPVILKEVFGEKKKKK